MKRLILGMAVVAVSIVTAWAAPALREAVAVVQPDGTTLVITLNGDEHQSWYTTSDGTLVVAQSGGYYVAAVDNNGVLTATQQLAHEPQQRSTKEQQLCTAQQEQRPLFYQQVEQRWQQVRRAHVTGTGYFPHKGSPKCLVILANFSDNQFSSDDPNAQFDQYFNGKTQENMGHNEQNNTVSVREYYNQSSNGQYTPDFTIVGPVTLPQTLEYYGADSGNTKDVNFNQFCKDAIDAVDGMVDFKDYDNMGDGKAELVCVIYAGYGQSVSGNGAETLWPKCGSKGISTNDGVTVSYMNCSPELYRVSKGNDINGIGLFCHEFSHGMGLPDLYVTNESAIMDNQSPEFWDVMDYGEYANGGYTPVPYSAWEREAMGWKEFEVLTESKAAIVMEPLNKGGKVYKFGNGANSEEWFMIDNQQPANHAAKTLGAYRGHGLLAWHIAYSSSTVNMGDYPNNTAGKPRVCLVPADGLVINGYRFGTGKPYTQAEYIASLQGDPFPGTSGKTELTAAMQLPNYQYYNGDATPVQSLTYIAEGPDSIITFDYNDGVNVITHQVESLTLDETLELETEDTGQLTAAVLPATAENKNVWWTTTNELVATVDTEGRVTAVSEGTAKIVARSEEHPFCWKACTVTVKAKQPSGISHWHTAQKAMPDVYYDLQGRRLDGKPTQRGIYILQGKKVMVR